MTITYRLCKTNQDFDAVKALEIEVWEMPNYEAITTHTLHVLMHIGGIVMGAFDDHTMIGMAVAFPSQKSGQLWSHMAAVHPDYQGQGIGYGIKQAQKEFALGLGYTQMHWTFDPAMRGNAHFNFHLLGARANLYHENFYGVMSDGINAGVPSDRFEAIWDLTRDRSARDTQPDTMTPLLRSENNIPIIVGQASDNYHTVDCPYDFRELKANNLDLALQWRYAMREVLQSAFETGYEVVDFINEHDVKKCRYILRKI